MKIFKIVYPIYVLLLGSQWVAQEISDHAIGLRFGDSDGFFWVFGGRGGEIFFFPFFIFFPKKKNFSLDRDNSWKPNLGWRDSRYFDPLN